MASPVIRSMFRHWSMPPIRSARCSAQSRHARRQLVTCVPSMDSGPTLMALEAMVTVANAAGGRRMPLAELFVGPRRTSLKPGDLLVDIVIPKENLDKRADVREIRFAQGPGAGAGQCRGGVLQDEGNFRGPGLRSARSRPRHSRTEGGSISRRPQDQCRGDGRSRPHRRNRGQADQRLPRQRRLPARSHCGAGQTRARQCARRAQQRRIKELVA